MERTLGVMCGAGTLPARMMAEARRQGWRVVAFTFDEAAPLDGMAERTIPSRLTEGAAVLRDLAAEGVAAAVFAGSFSMRSVLRIDPADADQTSRAVRERAGSRIDARMAAAVIALFGSVGVEVLDQRTFLGPLLGVARCWSQREPTPEQWADVRHGLGLARAMADALIGQTLVLKDRVVSAVEAVEGTTEAVRRGTALAGAGAVIVKAVARDHDYRFDVPAVGQETVEAAAAGGAVVIAVEAERVLVLDPERTSAAADAAGIALLSVDDR